MKNAPIPESMPYYSRQSILSLFPPAVFRRCLNGKWIADAKLIIDQQTVLHILGVHGFASSEKGCGHDHRIIKAKSLIK